jgi:putative endonuclease
MRLYFVYMLRCSDGSYYIGLTNDVERRVAEHQSGMIPKCYTHSRRPLKLVYRAEFREVTDAIAWEKHIKRWSRKKKEALARGDEDALKQFSKRRGGKLQ